MPPSAVQFGEGCLPSINQLLGHCQLVPIIVSFTRDRDMIYHMAISDRIVQ